MANRNIFGNLSFNGKSLLITGGDTGIGAATAKLAAQRGARVFIASLNEETLKKTLTRLMLQVGNASGSYVMYVIRISWNAQCRPLSMLMVPSTWCTVMRGCPRPTYTHEFHENIWHQVMEINVTGTFYSCKAVLQQFMKQGKGGNIVINGSMAALRVLDTWSLMYPVNTRWLGWPSHWPWNTANMEFA
jgi:NAD(P)-dependent dehydrogenase (short-subunit alcohol dehydrogenase family)